MQRAVRLICIVLLLAGASLAQTPPMPKPGPEHQRLHYFVGEWTNEGEMKASPFGPAGKFSGTDHNEMLGEFFLLLHSDMQMPMGAAKSVSVMGFDPKAKVYTYDAFDSMGQHSHSTGTISGSTWTWNAEENVGGKTFKGRFTIDEVSPSAYTYKYDVSEDGKTWNNIMQGKATKTK